MIWVSFAFLIVTGGIACIIVRAAIVGVTDPAKVGYNVLLPVGAFLTYLSLLGSTCSITYFITRYHCRIAYMELQVDLASVRYSSRSCTWRLESEVFSREKHSCCNNHSSGYHVSDILNDDQLD